MPVSAEKNIQEALKAFDFGDPVGSVERFGDGHVNDTFCVYTKPETGPSRCFILQRMSPTAFKHPEELMANILGITEFLGKKIQETGGDRHREALEVIPTLDGRSFYTDVDGGAWRVYPFVPDTCYYKTAQTPEVFASSARAFGRFQRMLADYPAETLYETIPRFHDTEDRLNKLKEAIRSAPADRLAACGPEIDFALARENDCSVALAAQRDGILPLRVTHNDTKLNNVLFDKDSGEAICVIDLDTTMPGLCIYDFGDSIRFGANHCAEDEKDLSKVNFDIELFEIYTKGFLTGAGGSLTAEELAYLPWGAKLMTLECGIRFLTDYLSGDVYFRIEYPEQNLDRCRTQFKLVRDMEEQWADIYAVIRKIRAAEQ